MEFSLNRLDLLEPLSKVVSVLEKRQTLPILSHVLVVVNQHGITLTATDQEVELQARIGVEGGSVAVEAEGSCALPGRKLLEISMWYSVAAPSSRSFQPCPPKTFQRSMVKAKQYNRSG
jgi:DNA polymerase III sliding clamp (beta) subunit (PCNA family)